MNRSHHAEILEVKPEVVPRPAPVGFATAISPDVHEARAQEPSGLSDLPGLNHVLTVSMTTSISVSPSPWKMPNRRRSIFVPLLGSAVDTITVSPAEAADRIRREPRCCVTRLPDHEQIARYAYELFLLRGAEDGRDLQDWFEAERHLTKAPQRRGKKPAARSPRRRSES
jgi:hypothetical protein